MLSHAGWAMSCGFNVINRVTWPSLCGGAVIWWNSNFEEMVFPLFYGQLSAHEHMVKTLERWEGCVKVKFEANRTQTLLWRQKVQTKRVVINTTDKVRLVNILLTSRQWEAVLIEDSLMKSSRDFGGLVWVGVGGGGDTVEETAPASFLIWSFWSRRSFLNSLAFRHGGRLVSAPTPASQREIQKG